MESRGATTKKPGRGALMLGLALLAVVLFVILTAIPGPRQRGAGSPSSVENMGSVREGGGLRPPRSLQPRTVPRAPSRPSHVPRAPRGLR